jgi:uncharacterized protein (DUF1778 family)
MAKQTKTGGAYSNYQVIKTGDTTGSSVALAQAAADVGSTVVQNKKDLNATREKELERFNKTKKTIASQVQARETSKQNALLDAGAAIEGSTLSENMREDFTESFTTEVNAIAEAQKVLDNPYASNEAKKKANESIFKAKGLIGNLNLTLKKSQEIAKKVIETKKDTYSAAKRKGRSSTIKTSSSGLNDAEVKKKTLLG